MSIEYTLSQIETVLVKLPDTPDTLAVSPRAWWSLAQVVLAGLLLTYLIGVVQDFLRVRELQAEPSTLSKVIITKNEAWNRVYPRLARAGTTDVAARPWASAALQP